MRGLTYAAFRSNVVIAVVVLLAANPSTGDAAQQARLHARFSPDRRGASTTIHFGFDITSTTGGVPSPVTDVRVDLPAGMGLGVTDLGEETCTSIALATFGPSGCSPNSRMGLGNATVEIPVGSKRYKFYAGVTIYMSVPQREHTTFLISAEILTPIYGQWLFRSELLPSGSDAYGAELNTAMPLIGTWPQGPFAVITHMETTLGPSHLTYYTRRHGKRVAYSPEGMAVPEHCPRGGFPFRATYHFADNSTTTATTSIPCPRTAMRRVSHRGSRSRGRRYHR